jgi:hypothetical protein
METADMRTIDRCCILISGLLAVATSTGCASFNPTPIDQVGFLDRAESVTKGDITVAVAVLSAEEAKAVFDTKLYKKKIQPIWLEITNGTNRTLAFLPRSVDQDYHSALEVAQKGHRMWSKKTNREKREYFFEQQLRLELPPGQTVSGFVFGNRDEGVRWMNIAIIGQDLVEFFEFVVEVPGFNADFHKLENIEIYAEDEITDLDERALLEWIESQPAFVTNKAGSKTGDPLNLVIIGKPEAVWPAFLRMGWDPTASMSAGSAVKTGVFGIFGGRYRYAPISDLYVYGRSQDIALQKVRNNIHYRNHLRLWKAPVTYRGLPVAIGQISRDIGSRFTAKSKTLTTHRIDPDVDETRASLIQDFLYAQALAVFGLAGGVGAISIEEPRGNLTGDPFFTDGRRAVLLLEPGTIPYEELEYFGWYAPDANPTGESPPPDQP